MESGPSKVAEIIAGWLVPPACREEILGDMRERYRSGLRYFLEAAHLIPCVIFSRICRTTDAVLALMEVASLYTAFVIVAKYFDPVLILGRSGFARLAIPPVIVLATMSLADAYSVPQRRWPLKPLVAPTLGFAVAYTEQSMYRQWSLPPSVFAWGSGTGLLLVSTLRLEFPSIADQPQAAHAPAFWQKLELVPLSLSPKNVLVPCGILLAVILYLLGR
jgi:hypothetical protein